ncbi:hypothetical protein BCR35DRAFT_352284 [Leucosporidium creatinivorum]|uniref:MARVEL domain-containing protein n=1 Tax=Leucosporidium creatinivorum TaxID=106004 RepID=A0A1Y2FCY9_9BASI|nr:hypothetical protein BCR35DRAFT_352284 [Leucosporidium creatinivorum]
MGLFLHGKWITAGVVFLGFALGIFMFSYYIWILAHHVKFPTVLTEVVAVFSMLFWFAWALQSLATCHSIHQKSKQLSFGRWSIMGLVSISFDLLYFGMMVNYSGFTSGNICSSNTKRDESTSSSMCSHRAAAIGLAVAIFISAIFRLFGLLVVWHWDVRWNQTPAAVNNAPTPATPATAPATTKAQSLPKRRRTRPKPSVVMSDDDEQVQLFPAAPSRLHARDFDFSDSDSDSDSDSLDSDFVSSSEDMHLRRESRSRV